MAFLDSSQRTDFPELISDGIEALRSVAKADTDGEFMTAMTRLMNCVSALSEIGTNLIENQTTKGRLN